jgi:HK97 gp10 family phage protein
VRITVYDTGIDDLMRRLDVISNESRYRPTRVKALRAGIRVAERYAKAKVPVDTGNLKNAIAVGSVSDTQAVLVASTNYAAYVEFGTRRMAARPYMRPAVEDHIEEIEDVMGRVIDEALNER